MNLKLVWASLASIVIIGAGAGSGAVAAAEICGPARISESYLHSHAEQTCFADDAVFESSRGGILRLPKVGGISTLSTFVVDGVDPVEEIVLHRDRFGRIAARIGKNLVGALSSRLSMQSQQSSAAIGLAVAPAGCSNPAEYTLLSSSWTSSYDWWYRTASAPSGASLTRIQSAISTASDGQNRCGLSIWNNSSANYKGVLGGILTNDSSGGCGTFGGDLTHSQVGWGILPTATLATTCTFGYGIAFDVDTMFNTNYSWYSGANASSCPSGSYDLQGVATHEAGHAFGLGHVGLTSAQVMKPKAPSCDATQRLLGIGDATGMQALY